MKRALCISGGGADGAFAIGVESVIKKDYNLYVGTSTGALCCLMIAQKKYEKARDFYTTITNSDIYDTDPFNHKNDLSITKSAIGVVMKKQSFSSTNKLLELIRKEYTKSTHISLQSKKEIIVAVTNMNTGEPEYKSNKDHTWLEFTYWVWVSTLAYPYCETVVVNGTEYADGGFTVPLPIEKACDKADVIRAIILSERNKKIIFKNKTVLQGIPSSFKLSLLVNLKANIREGIKYLRKGKDIQFIYMPYEIDDESMLFLPEKANTLYNLGLEVGLDYI